MTAGHGEGEPPVEFEAIVRTRDDVELSLTISLPRRPDDPGGADGRQAAGGQPAFPVILDCHPYRKDDLFSFRGAGLYEYFNMRGFATARMDVRGTGRSGGSVPAAEYSDAEISDCVEVIGWLAAQPWCNGSVGMWGISWSAINTLLVAARRPPALRACIAVHPSDELFASDIHYIDGLFHYDLYELSIDLLNGITPGPDFPLGEQVLADRFDQPPWLASVLAHQRRDGYWRGRSLAPWYERISCPVFLVGGWYDGYHECVFRLLDQLAVPVQASVGPWTHVLPHMGGPGDPVDWLGQAADWWDRWLRGDDEAAAGRAGASFRDVSVFARDWHGPAGPETTVTGTWHRTTVWPVPDMHDARLVLSDGQLLETGGESAGDESPGDDAGSDMPPPHQAVINSPPWIGQEVGHWWGDLAADQAPLDSECLVFDSAPLQADVDILGSPTLRVRAEPSAGAHLFARLEDVAPDGRVTLVTGAGTAVPGHGAGTVEIPLALHWTSWRFPASHRIRISLSTALWPMFWPATRTGPVTIQLGGHDPSELLLPVPPGDWGTREQPPAAERPSWASGYARPEPVWERDRAGERAQFTWATTGSTQLDFATMTSGQQLVFSVDGGPDTDATASGEASMTVETDGPALSWRILTSLHSSGERYEFTFRRILSRDGETVRERCWEYTIPRPLQ